MEFMLQPTNLFLDQLKGISKDARKILENKISLAKLNPYRNKRIHYQNLLLFRIRFEDSRKEKRMIYLVEPPFIMLVCILDRDRNYKDLEAYLKKVGF